MVKELLAKEEADNARELFQEVKQESTVDYYFVKGLVEQKFQKWGPAINSFQKVLELEPEHTEARNHIRLIQSVLNFWNPEMFNHRIFVKNPNVAVGVNIDFQRFKFHAGFIRHVVKGDGAKVRKLRFGTDGGVFGNFDGNLIA